jgi:hypothetical protein
MEADVNCGRIVDDGFVVDVSDMGAAEIIHGPVLVAGAHIAEAVIDAAMESDMRPPIASIVDVDPVIPAPITPFAQTPDEWPQGWTQLVTVRKNSRHDAARGSSGSRISWPIVFHLADSLPLEVSPHDLH